MHLDILNFTDIEMGRLITGAENPTVLYVSGGNTQVTIIINSLHVSVSNTRESVINDKAFFCKMEPSIWLNVMWIRIWQR